VRSLAILGGIDARRGGSYFGATRGRGWSAARQATGRIGLCKECHRALSLGLIQWSMSQEEADAFMDALRDGRTLRRITGGGKFGRAIASLTGFKKHCKLNPEWGIEARRLAAINAKAADSAKGAYGRSMTVCRRGLHPLTADNILYDGKMRRCRECRRLNNLRAPVMEPSVVLAVTRALEGGATLGQICQGKPVGGGKVNRKLVLTRYKVLKRHRQGHPEFDRFVIQATAQNNFIGQRIRYARERRLAQSAAKRRETNDYLKIWEMVPAYLPGREDIAQDIFVALLEKSLKLEDVAARLKWYEREHEKKFPTRFAKFGDSPLVSLDEQLFDDGGTTRGDTVCRTLWD
jgi:hypothetical protein